MDETMSYEHVGLDNWLKKIMPRVEEALDANVKNNIFANYKAKETDLDADMDDDGGVS